MQAELDQLISEQPGAGTSALLEPPTKLLNRTILELGCLSLVGPTSAMLAWREARRRGGAALVWAKRVRNAGVAFQLCVSVTGATLLTRELARQYENVRQLQLRLAAVPAAAP